VFFPSTNREKVLAMPVNLPFAASSPRELSDKPRPIPKSVQLACLYMIHQGIDFVAAARANNIKPDTLRRHLSRGETLAYIRRERAAFRQSICAANEFYLAAIRNNSENEMARTKAISLLEQIDDQAIDRPSRDVTPGITIRVLSIAPQPVDITPLKAIDAGD
jgi:hypothetical protein